MFKILFAEESIFNNNLFTYSRVQKKVNIAYRNYYVVITDRSTNCYLPIPLSV